MAGVRGNRDTLSDTTIQPRQVADQLVNISPKSVPFLKHIGIDGEAGTNPKREWQEDVLHALTATMSATVTMNDTTSGTVTLSASDAWNFGVGDIILIESEQLRVTALASDTTLTVTRGWGSTTAATHDASETITRVGHNQLENVDSVTGGTSIHDFPFNYYQIFDRAVQVSHRAQQTGEYNVDDRMDLEVSKVLKDYFHMLERTAFYGKRVAQTATVPSSAGGLDTFITDNTDTTAEALSEKKINDLLALIYDDVGHDEQADLIVVNQWQKRKISDMWSSMARMERGERTGGVVVDVIDTVFGKVDVMMVHNMPAGVLYLLNTKHIKYAPYKNSAFFVEDLPESGPYFKQHVYGDYTLEVRGDKSHGRMSGLTTS